MPWGQWAEGENSGHGDFSRAGLAAAEGRVERRLGPQRKRFLCRSKKENYLGN